MDTIYAQATARGKAGVAIIRISGPRAWEITEALAGHLPEPRFAVLRSLRFNDELLDQALVLCFEEKASFTGEKVCELHLHGSVATVSAVLNALSTFDHARLAEPGEFTRRAMENGQLDLTQVEGLADLIESETEAQRRQALLILSGSVGKKVEDWRRKLVRSCALLEATIDFVDEDVPVDVSDEVNELLCGVLSDLEKELNGLKAAERVREGYEVAIVGRPNSGKSTLLNMLSGREAAITSDIAGTTRDIIEVRMNLSGLAVTFLDTAGLRNTDDIVEEIGVKRAIERAERADLRIFLLDDYEIEELSAKPGDIQVYGKADIYKNRGRSVSGLTGQGVDDLVSEITNSLLSRSASAGTMTRERHRLALEKAILSLKMAQEELAFGNERIELSAEFVREAIITLEMLLGKVNVDTFLDEIFSSFCIGK